MTPALIFLAVFPVAFGGVWLIVGTMVMAMTGWFGLMARFPDRPGAPLARFTWVSGYLGVVRLDNALILEVCQEGLRLAFPRILAPFSRPIFVAWGELLVERTAGFMGPRAVLALGRPTMATLKIAASLADRMARAAGRNWPERA